MMNSNYENNEQAVRRIPILRSRLQRGLLIGISILIISCAILWVLIHYSIPETIKLKTGNPDSTSLIEQRCEEALKAGKKLQIRQYWVNFGDVPEMLIKAIRISEDANFYFHNGIDYDELKEAVKKNWAEGSYVRGGSTITQQLAKNLYLSTEKSLLRKIREYFIARRLESTLSKQRIFDLYLNVIEFGPGIFGVEAAARYYFNKNVSNLNLEEIIRLTAIIPRPLTNSANGRSRWLLWRCRWIVGKLLLYKYIDQASYDTLMITFS
jgi:monofunctional biosynthetic peptidoglycan transglycosylase